MLNKPSIRLFLIVILIISSYNSLTTIKTQKDFVASTTNIDADATTIEGNSKSIGISDSNSAQLVANVNGVRKVTVSQSNPISAPAGMGNDSDIVLSTSTVNSSAKSTRGDSLGVADSTATALRAEVDPKNKDPSTNIVGAGSSANSKAVTQDGDSVSLSNSSAISSNLLYDKDGNLLNNPIPVITLNNPIWFNTGKSAVDIGVGSQGILYIAGTDKNLYLYDQPKNAYTQVDDIIGVVRVDTSYDGTPYVVTMTGETFYQTCGGSWIRLPGCASDIGVGRGGDVFKTGCDTKSSGFAIYKLFCKCKCKCCAKGCKRYKHNRSADVEKKCEWFRFVGSGVRIDVTPHGLPIVVHQDGNVAAFNGNDWYYIGGLSALDVSVSNQGILYAVGKDNNLYRLTDESQYTFTRIPSISNVTNVTVGPLGLPYVTTMSGFVLTSSKTNFN
jgi:hypothetical protein